MNRIFIIGYMGAGKTTVGRILAVQLGYQFVDLDLFIENRQHKTISEIFEEYGESYFRRLESNILREVAEFENVVIAVGGGTPCFNGNIGLMNRSGITLYLRACAEELSDRLESCKYSRPLIKNKSKKELSLFVAESLSKREPYYLQSLVVLDTGRLQNKEAVIGVVERAKALLSSKINNE